MKTKIFAFFALMTAAIILTGCVGTVDGRVKAGVPFTKDRIVSRYERPVPQIVSATQNVLARLGQIEAYETVGNSFHAKVDNRNVWVKISEVEPQLAEVVVQARTRAGGADVDLASEIDKQIALQLATTR